MRLNNGGHIEEGDFRYTCESAGGCEVVNRTVTAGVVVETSKGDGEPSPVADDHGDSRSAATSLTLGTPVAGRIDPDNDTDYFRLRLSQSTVVAIYTTGSLDTTGSLQDSSGNQVDFDDDGGSGTNFRIEATLSAGTHYIAVEAYSNSRTGSYTLHAERQTTDPADLVVLTPTVSDSSPDTGESFTLRATVRNQGGDRSAATTLRYYRSSNATISTSDVQVGTDSVRSLAASASSAESISLAAPSTAGTYYYGACVEGVSGEADSGNNCSSGVRVTVRRGGGTGPAPPSGTQYTPLEGWTVSRGRVQFLFFSAGRCVLLSNTTINGVTYTIHSSKWQRRANADSAWEDIPGTEATGSVCSYTPSASGQYRGVAEITIGGRRGNYATNNILSGP